MRWLDHAYLAVVPRVGCFVDGWGDRALLDMALDGRWSDVSAPPAQPRWTRSRVHGRVRVRDGWIESPEPGLPPEGRVARVRLLEPRHGEARGLAVVLASWGDDTWPRRERIFGPAIDHGVALLLLENPFYGQRRRVGQRDTNLLAVSDFVLMGRAIMREALSLLGWARERGYPRIGVTGFSMGGQMAALTAALSPDPVHVATIAPSATPRAVFVDGPLRRDVAWRHLGADLAVARARLGEVMESLSVLSLPPPKDPRGVVLVGTRRDAFVQPGDVGAIARHWGVHPRWLDDGHVSIIAWRSHAIAQALIDAYA